MKRHPITPRQPAGPDVDRLRRASDIIDHQDERGHEKGLGAPRQGIIQESTKAALGDLLYVDPSTAEVNGAGVYLYVYLPKADRAHIGDIITVKNYSTSTRRIQIQPVWPDTIDKANYKRIEVAWGMATIKMIEEDKWICIAQNGCSDCTGSCLATCADTCDGNCVGSCKNARTGSCTDCTGSCATALSGSCSGCSGSCATALSGSCSGCSGSCAETESGSCTDCAGSCASTLSGSCSDCTGGCNTGCSTGCQTGCSTGCLTTCSTGCQTGCKTGCQTTCIASCMWGCDHECIQSCDAACADTET